MPPKQKPTKQSVDSKRTRSSVPVPTKPRKRDVSLGDVVGVAATLVGPGKVVKGAKVAAKGAKVVRDVVRGKRTYYHGSPNEIPVGSVLRNKAASGGKSSATNKKSLAESYAKGRLTLTPEGVKKTSGNLYKVKSQSGKVTSTKKFGNAKEYNAEDFVVVKKIKPKGK